MKPEKEIEFIIEKLELKERDIVIVKSNNPDNIVEHLDKIKTGYKNPIILLGLDESIETMSKERFAEIWKKIALDITGL